MRDNLTAAEALMVAMNQEQEGIRFYRNAAEMCDKQELKDTFLMLMREEEKHLEEFTKMKESVSQDEADRILFDDPTTLSTYISELVDYQIFEEEVQDQFSEDTFENVSQVIELGLKAEKLAVLFYLGISMFTKNSDTVEMFDRIAAEEMKHVEMLKEILESEG